MDPRFSPHNTHLEDPKHFSSRDPQLRQLKHQQYVHISDLLDTLPVNLPGIYTLGGGRQIGKTTLLKQWMLKLLTQGVTPAAISFLSGELIDDHHALLHILQRQLTEMPSGTIRYLLLDEVTYIRDWDKAVKYAADAGWLEDVVLVLTGSDLILIQEARMRFPGRRGRSNVVNFHLYPLSFYEVVKLKGIAKQALCKATSETVFTEEVIKDLFATFHDYLLHGGYLTAINEMAIHGKVSESTLMTYSDWVRGDVLKRGKQEHYLKEILSAIIKRYCCQVTWNALARDLSIDHPKTVADYTALLESMDAVFVQPALLEDKLLPAPKKARKLMFADPFIFHAIKAWLDPVKNPFEEQMKAGLNKPELCSAWVEACAATHYRRYYPTYYIKAEGEVDIAYVHKNRFWPVEVKWTNQLRPSDLKQVLKYPNSVLLTKALTSGERHGIHSEPLPVALWKLGILSI